MLENTTLDLKTMFDQARPLDSAQKSMESYSQTMFHEPTVNAVYQPLNLKPGVNDEKRCWNCGNSPHARSKCPARDTDCFNCGKKGHFAKFCHSKRDVGTQPVRKSTAAFHFPTIA